MSLAPRIAHTETSFHAFFLFCHSRLFLIVLFRPLSEDDAILILPTKAPRCKTEHAIKKFLTTLNCKIVYMLIAYIIYIIYLISIVSASDTAMRTKVLLEIQISND